MTRHIVSASLIVVAIIHLLPLAGVLGGPRLTALYGIDASDPNLELLLRHRAVLFGLLGCVLMAAAFRPAWQPAALLAGVVSVVSFLLLAWLVGDLNLRVGRVVTADRVALLCLLVGVAARRYGRATGA